MDELEKVINGLECHIKPRMTCKGCDYFTSEGYCHHEALYRDALSLLKAQEPIAPKLIKMYPHDIYECGNCEHRSVGSKDYKAKYCPECGRKVKWD